MKLGGNTILITGGGSGIGFALAQRFLKADSEVIICGRRSEKLAEAKKLFPDLHIKECDLIYPADRKALYNWIVNEFPRLNVLINNAGIQRRYRLSEDQEDWETRHQEIAINLEAPIHLSSLLIPHLSQKTEAAIINISSGLAFTPGTFATVYSATKAAIHNLTMSLRQELSRTTIKVIEVIPPAVNTDLGGSGLHTAGEPLDDFADAIIEKIAIGELEIGYGRSEIARKASREELDEMFKRMNQQ